MRKIDLIRSLFVFVAASDKKFDRSVDQNIDILTIDINTVSMFWSKVHINFVSIYWPCLQLHQIMNIFGTKVSGIFHCNNKKVEDILIQIELHFNTHFLSVSCTVVQIYQFLFCNGRAYLAKLCSYGVEAGSKEKMNVSYQFDQTNWPLYSNSLTRTTKAKAKALAAIRFLNHEIGPSTRSAHHHHYSAVCLSFIKPLLENLVNLILRTFTS